MQCGSQLPPPPVGDLCELKIGVDLASSYGVCEPINKTTLAQVKYPRNADGSYNKPLADMDKSEAVDATTWGNIEAYILKLKEGDKNNTRN